MICRQKSHSKIHLSLIVTNSLPNDSHGLISHSTTSPWRTTIEIKTIRILRAAPAIVASRRWTKRSSVKLHQKVASRRVRKTTQQTLPMIVRRHQRRDERAVRLEDKIAKTIREASRAIAAIRTITASVVGSSETTPVSGGCFV